MSWLNAIAQFFKGADLFGAPVQLTYQSNRVFTTCCGGLISILMCVSLATGLFMELSKQLSDPEFLSSSPKTRYFNYDPSL